MRYVPAGAEKNSSIAIWKVYRIQQAVHRRAEHSIRRNSSREIVYSVGSLPALNLGGVRTTGDPAANTILLGAGVSIRFRIVFRTPSLLSTRD